MNVITRADERAWAAVDEAVLWLWNEWGVPWRDLARGLIIATYTLSMLDSHLRDGWGIQFWLALFLGGPIMALLFFVVSFMPKGAQNGSSVQHRAGLFSFLLRVYIALNICLDAAGGRPVAVAAGLSWMAMWLALMAREPTRPRRPRRAPALAYALGGAR